MCAQSLGQEDPLEEEMVTHSSSVAWIIPWTEERGGLRGSWGCKESDTTEHARKRVPKKPNSLGGKPTGFCSSKKLQFSVCKASSTAGSVDSCSALTDTWGSKLWGQKCSIVLRSMNLGWSDGDFPWRRTCPHLPWVKERRHDLAVSSSLSEESELFLELTDSRNSSPLY